MPQGATPKHLAIVTCMDARVDVLGAFGLAVSDVHLLRNAGAVITDDVLRSLVLSERILDTRSVRVVGHTDCALRNYSDAELADLLVRETGTAPTFEFGTFHDLDEHVRTSVERIRICPWLPYVDDVTGWVYDVADHTISALETNPAAYASPVRTVAYFGPPGTFTEEALLTQDDLAACERTAQRSVPDVIAAVEHGEFDAGLVPIENMIEGSVSVTLDTLAFDSELLIQREIDLPVSLSLCAKPGVALADVRTVVSFPHALAQCRGWLANKLPRPTRVVVLDGRGGVRGRRSRSAPTSPRSATRSRPRCTASTCSPPRSRTTPRTRPASCSSAAAFPRRPGHDKTTIVCFQREDRPGSLLAILQEFAARAINLTKLESRPTKRGLGDYCFFIDVEGHVADELVADGLRNLAAKQAEVKFLGSYPVGGPMEAGVERRRAARARVEARRVVGRAAARADPRDERRSDRPQATARRAGVPARHRAQARARRADRRGARGRRERAARSSQEVEALRARQNAASKEIGKAAPDERPAKIEAAAALKEELAAKEKELQAVDAGVPRARAASAEPGRRVGARRRRRRRRGARGRRRRRPTRPPLDHAAFSDAIGFVDTARGAEASGSRFAYIMREAALLELALVNYAMQHDRRRTGSCR